MENSASLLMSSDIYCGESTAWRIACILPLVGEQTPVEPVMNYYAPGKPSRGHWFHACKRTKMPTQTVVHDGVTRTIVGEHYFSYKSDVTGKNNVSYAVVNGKEYYIVRVSTYKYQGMYVNCTRQQYRGGAYISSGTNKGKYLYEYGSTDVTWKISDDYDRDENEVLANASYYISEVQKYKTTWTTTTASKTRLLTSNPVVPQITNQLSFDYKYGEINDWFCVHDLDFIPNRLVPGLSAAYLACVENIPKAQVNSIDNCRQSIGAIRAIVRSLTQRSITPVIREICDGVSDPKNAWLAYRYTVKTTESDLSELQTLTSRLQDLSSFRGQEITLRGAYTTGDKTYRCAVTYQLCDLLPHDLTSWLDTYGFRLNLENVWDMVPFSFMVDWFTHIGDFLNNVDTIYLSHQYKPKSIWYSYETNYDNQAIYMRFPGPALYSSPFTQHHETKGSTWAMRLADVLSIFG